MNDQQQVPNPDSFDQVLNDLDRLPAVRPDLAESIFAQTRPVLTRRRWFRRGRMLVVCVLCYGVGIGSGWLLKPTPVVVAVQNTRASPDAKNQPVVKQESRPGRFIVDVDVPQSETTQNVGPNKSQTPIKSKADSPPRVAQVTRPVVRSPFEDFRRAGDRQLYERGNVRTAMDCYRRALSHATDQQLRVEFDRDSWLFMSLKQSRLEERKHVRQKRV